VITVVKILMQVIIGASTVEPLARKVKASLGGSAGGTLTAGALTEAILQMTEGVPPEFHPWIVLAAGAVGGLAGALNRGYWTEE
jgi:hypothetical protein